MYTIFGGSNVELCKEVGKIDPLRSSLGKKIFMSLNLRISKNILQIGKPKASKSKFMHTLLETKSIFAIEQKAIVSRFVKDVAFLLGHPVYIQRYMYV